MGKPKRSMASQLYPGRETENNYCAQVKKSAHTMCQGQTAFPVDISTRETELVQADKYCYLNYSNFYPSRMNIISMEGKRDSSLTKDSQVDPCRINSSGNEPQQPFAAISYNKNNNDYDVPVNLSGENNASSDANREAELLGLEMPIDIMTDTLDESLLCTPSQGVVAIESMSINDNMVELENNRSVTPVQEQDSCEPTRTPVWTKTTNDALFTPNKPNPLTQEQTEAIKQKLNDLSCQASTLTATSANKPEKIVSNSADVVLSERQLGMQERQLTA